MRIAVQSRGRGEKGSQSDEGVKCHKCHVSRPHKDKLCIAPKVRACTHAPVQLGEVVLWIGGWGSMCEHFNVQYTQFSLLVHTVWGKWPCKNKLCATLKGD